MEKIEELIAKYTNIFNQSKPNFSDDTFSRGEDEGAGRVSHEIVEDLKQLKSSLPKPVEVPEFVAEWYENNKDYPLGIKFIKAQRAEAEKIQNWYDNCEGRHVNKRANAQEVIAKMDLYGYTVEKEQLYYVRLKNAVETHSSHCYLWLNQSTKKVYFGVKTVDWTNQGNVKNRFTESEIAAISDGAFIGNKAFEIVQVEEEEK